MRVAIFGGSFNPPTLAHLRVAEGVLAEKKRLRVDQVWMMPVFTHTFGKEMLDFDARMRLCRIAVGDKPGIFVSNFEEKIAGRTLLETGTMKTLCELISSYSPINGVSFRIVIGLDNAIDIERWRYSKELRALASFIVVPRPGYVHDPKAWYMTDSCSSSGIVLSSRTLKNDYLPGLSTGDVSSSQVRGYLKMWTDRAAPPPDALKGLLDPAVIEEIRSQNLYL